MSASLVCPCSCFSIIPSAGRGEELPSVSIGVGARPCEIDLSEADLSEADLSEVEGVSLVELLTSKGGRIRIGVI